MKLVDQIHQCRIPGQTFGFWTLQFHLQIFQPHAEVQTVLITDMGFEMGWFIPFLIEQLIEQIVKEFHLDPAKVVWIEHYKPVFEKPTFADFSQVTFEWDNGCVRDLQWRTLAPETAEALICQMLLPSGR